MGLIEQYGRYALYAGGAFSALALVLGLYVVIDLGAGAIGLMGVIFAVLGAGSLTFYGITLLDAANAERHADAMEQWGKNEPDTTTDDQ